MIASWRPRSSSWRPVTRGAVVTAPREPVDLGLFCEWVIEHYKARPSDPKTLYRVDRILGWLKRDFKVRSTSGLHDRRLLARFEALCERIMKPGSVRTYVTTYYAIVGLAWAWGLLIEEPAFEKVPDSRSEKWTDKHGGRRLGDSVSIVELKRLLSRDRRPRNLFAELRMRALIAVVALCRVKVSVAVRRLRVADFKLESALLCMGACAASDVPMSDDLVKIVSEFFSLPEMSECEWAFPGSKRLGPWQLEANYPENPRGHLEARCNERMLRRITFPMLCRFRVTHGQAPALGVAEGRRRLMVIINGESEEVFIGKESKGVLLPSEYGLIELLHKSFPRPLSMAEITRKTGGSETWRKAWQKMRKDADWGPRLIGRGEIFEGKKSTGYLLNKY